MATHEMGHQQPSNEFYFNLNLNLVKPTFDMKMMVHDD